MHLKPPHQQDDTEQHLKARARSGIQEKKKGCRNVTHPVRDTILPVPHFSPLFERPPQETASVSGLCLRQTPEHDADHGDGDPGFFTTRKHFIIFGKPAPRGKPGEGALRDPTVGKNMKTTGTDLLPINHGIFRCPDPSQATPRVFDNFHLPAQGVFDPLGEASLVIAAIRPDQLKTRETPLQRFEQEFSAVIVLNTGFMHQDVEDQSGGIDKQMPLATLDLFAAVIAAKPPFWLVLTD